MSTSENVRSYNVGKSDYAKHAIQPWDIWKEYNLNPWDADIVKRVLRTKEGEDRKLDYEKIIHVCKERIRQLETERADAIEENDEPDYKTVMCPSEKDKPELLYQDGVTFNNVYEVYGVFQSYDGLYAYLGCQGGTHVYLDLGNSHKWGYFTYDWMPKRAFGLSGTKLNGGDHAVSMEIGDYGFSYDVHDYIMAHGKLYRYLGITPEGHVYMRFEDDGSFAKAVTEHKILNDAVQHVKGNNK